MKPTDEPIFSASDFHLAVYEHEGVVGRIPLHVAERVAQISQAKLEKLLGPVVFGWGDEHGNFEFCYQRDRNDTHTARLFNVQEIKKVEPCEHMPEVTNDNGRFGIIVSYGPGHPKCRKCGIKLKATWAVDE